VEDTPQLAAPLQCYAAPVLQPVLVASFLANFLANFLASDYLLECVDGEFSEVRMYGVLGSRQRKFQR
jgi:hypothetical protein